MEEDEATPKRLPPWVELEYSQMLTLAGPTSTVLFTHLSEGSGDALRATLSASLEQKGVATLEVHTAPILSTLQDKGVPLESVCLLDPKAEKELSPEDAQTFGYFLFGGILGDDPPRDRTSELRALGFPSRHLGSVQMTTDTALGVTKKVVHDKVPLDQIPYVDFPTIRFNAKESVEMPFRYIADNGQPILPPGMRELLHEDLNKSFEF
ncbi:DUF431-domain-containing protein [Coniophora puteana RWD-64-598 SS2]|uniref:DUF431-domain-containing protein n=1 Tax=Coniophora puteana (strain RWD-64-598) TaxID=741705 RepID=A0A5M3MLC3_CONPW|nr:DUF431-domain-containing protein [Coniophora puteana RWD-64-598 SS2]EIW79760.1 DUF431-domain-containing protein [Coniophora puteana RWD-64-598 SS2]